MDVAEQILAAMPAQDRRVGRAWAVVTQASPLEVKFPGDDASVPMKRMSGYTPSVDDVALLVRFGSRWVAIGALA